MVSMQPMPIAMRSAPAPYVTTCGLGEQAMVYGKQIITFPDAERMAEPKIKRRTVPVATGLGTNR